MSRLKKFNIIMLIVNAALLIIFAVLMIIISSYKSDYTSDNVKKIWDNKAYKYAQISTFLTPLNSLDEMGVYMLRKSIEDKFKESSILNDENNPAGRLWIDSASGESYLSIVGKMGICEVTATGTFGDYFIFHPEDILFGSYYTSDDINLDRIILDKQTSWQLFGSMNTVDMPVNIGSKVFYVAAVVDTSENEHDKLAYGETPRVYLPYESLKELDPEFTLTAYEACIPNIVKDYALTVMQDVISAPENERIIVDQSGRFNFLTLVNGFQKIPESVMVKTNLSLPWYENRIRSAEIIARILAGPAVIMLIIPAFSLVYALYILTKLGGAGIRKIKEKADNNYQKKISEVYYSKRNKKD